MFWSFYPEYFADKQIKLKMIFFDVWTYCLSLDYLHITYCVTLQLNITLFTDFDIYIYIIYLYILHCYQSHSNINELCKRISFNKDFNLLFTMFANLHIWFQSFSIELKSRLPQCANWVEMKSCTRLHELNAFENTSVKSLFALWNTKTISASCY